jgi:hypothetical protein
MVAAAVAEVAAVMMVVVMTAVRELAMAVMAAGQVAPAVMMMVAVGTAVLKEGMRAVGLIAAPAPAAMMAPTLPVVGGIATGATTKVRGMAMMGGALVTPFPQPLRQPHGPARKPLSGLGSRTWVKP